jgi:hypothetical protein
MSIKKENSFLRTAMRKFMGMNQTDNKLTYYGKKYKTDKVTHHQYDDLYDIFLNKFYDASGCMIEIGIDSGKSLNMWLKVFNKAHIYGMDIDLKYSGERHDVFKTDQSDPLALDKYITKITKSNLFFINDDGSHIPEHQLLTFNKLFPLLSEDGVYIIEDIETSYWTRNGLYGYATRYGYKHKKSIIEIFKDVCDAVNQEFIKKKIHTPIKHLQSIRSIMFGRNCIIILKKQPNARKYRYFRNL